MYGGAPRRTDCESRVFRDVQRDAYQNHWKKIMTGR